MTVYVLWLFIVTGAGSTPNFVRGKWVMDSTYETFKQCKIMADFDIRRANVNTAVCLPAGIKPPGA
jgi:hypothetical protein